jgi:hypothetical protein
MANRHYDVNREYGITLNFKVTASHISDYSYLSEEDIKQILDGLEDKLKSHFLWKLSMEYRIEDAGADYITFQIED